MGKRRKRHLKTAGILIVIFVLSLGSVWYLLRARSNDTALEDQEFQSDSSNIVTAAGVTEIGTEDVTFAIDFLEDTRLYVEDVYFSNGDIVAAGEMYIKFTDDSIEKARAELEKAVQNTELDYRSKVISNGEDRIQAKYTYDMAVLEAEFALQVYQDTLTQLEMQLVKAQKVFEEAQQEYNVYYNAVANNTFYEDYQIEALKKAYDDAYDLFVSRRAYWEVMPEELDALDNQNYAQEGQSDRQWIIRTVALLKKEMMEAQEKYEQARQAYQREIEGAELKLQTLLNQLERAQQDLIDAQLAQQKGSLHAKTLYELAAARGQIAESDYNVCLMSLADELEHLKDAKEKAVENKAFFEELIGDGYLYTEQAGTVFMTHAEKGQALAGGDLILSYENPEKLFVSVMVPEKSAALLFVGEKASVAITDVDSIDGMVEAIQPITTSGGKAVGYRMVTVSLDGDVNMVEPNQAAAVVFGRDTQDDIAQCNAGTSSTEACQTVLQMYDMDIYDSGISAEADKDDVAYLKIAEVYVEAGQHINEGDQVCQLTQDSVENVRKMLTDTQFKAGIALAQTQARYHIGVLEAGLSHNEAVIGKTLAQTAYDNTIAKLNSGMMTKILAAEQLLADIYQMQTALTDDDYQKEKVDITRAYDEAREQVEKARECFVTSQVEAAQNFQAARAAYEIFFKQLEASNQQIADKIAEVYTLQEDILQSRQLMEKELLTAEQTRISAQTEGEIANAKYADILTEYENAVNKAQSDFDQAVRRLEEFNQFVGNGTIYAAGSGFVTEVGCKKGDLLVDTRKLVAFVADMDTNRLMEEGEQEDTQ